jgi:steroid delta-isomerase-like uncharacterized protein
MAAGELWVKHPMARARSDGTLARRSLKESGQLRSSGATLMGEPSTIAERIYGAYGRGDLDACLRLFAPDCRVIFPGAPPLSGPEQIRPFLQAQLNAFPNGRHNVRRMIEQGALVAVELAFTGEHTGPYATPSGAIPPSGRQVTFESVDIVEVNAGRISSWRVYLDTASMMTQLGANPALASA